MLKRIAILIAVALSIVIALSIVFLLVSSFAKDETTRNESGQIETSGQIEASVVKVGDCLNNVPPPDSDEPVADVLGVPCNEPHNYQVYFIGELNKLKMTEYSRAMINKAAGNLCFGVKKQVFASLSDSAKREYSATPASPFFPGEGRWNSGYKTVQCVIGDDTYKHSTSIFD
jgi:hypothetical protein